MLHLAAFTIQQQSGIVAVETRWPAKPKIYYLAPYGNTLPSPGIENFRDKRPGFEPLLHHLAAMHPWVSLGKLPCPPSLCFPICK